MSKKITPTPIPIFPASEADLAYTFLRHVGFILDDLSAQGLVLWTDDNYLWHWRWRDTGIRSSQGFWALGEAIVDATITRYPHTFAGSITVEG